MCPFDVPPSVSERLRLKREETERKSRSQKVPEELMKTTQVRSVLEKGFVAQAWLTVGHGETVGGLESEHLRPRFCPDTSTLNHLDWIPQFSPV
jgi:hypothetical protein